MNFLASLTVLFPLALLVSSETAQGQSGATCNIPGGGFTTTTTPGGGLTVSGWSARKGIVYHSGDLSIRIDGVPFNNDKNDGYYYITTKAPNHRQTWQTSPNYPVKFIACGLEVEMTIHTIRNTDWIAVTAF